MSDYYFGTGTTPERVREAIEQAKSERKRDKPPADKAKAAKFFENIERLHDRAAQS